MVVEVLLEAVDKIFSAFLKKKFFKTLSKIKKNVQKHKNVARKKTLWYKFYCIVRKTNNIEKQEKLPVNISQGRNYWCADFDFKSQKLH